VEHLYWMGSPGTPSSTVTSILNPLLQFAKNITKISFRYNTLPDITHFLTKIIKPNLINGNLKNLNSFRLTSVSGDGKLTKPILQAIKETQIKWKELELGDSLWEDAVPKSLQKLMKYSKDTLTSFVVQGGFCGESNKPMFVLKLPPMPKLEKLSICRKYTYETKKSPGQDNREIVLDDDPSQMKFSLKFQSEFPNLEILTLGKLTELDGFSFSLAKNLKAFRCGSNWNLTVPMPPIELANITELQFPDSLTEEDLVFKSAKAFPNLLKVRLNVPSVKVLYAFFTAFASSKVKELFLQTQFNFEGMLESALFPDFKLEPSTVKKQKTLMTLLKKYKWADEFLRENKIELPTMEKDEIPRKYKGLLGLKRLKKFHMIHIPRAPVFIPKAKEERKWFDPNCQLTQHSIGCEFYPISYEIFMRILKMKLNEFFWAKMDDDQIDEKHGIILNAKEFCSSEDDELFVPSDRKVAVPPNAALNPVKSEDTKMFDE